MPELSRPPRVPKLAEMPAIVEPPLDTMPAYSGLEIENWEPIDVDVEETISEEVVRAVRDVALESKRVRELLGDGRHVVVGVSAFDDKGERPRFVVVAYSYEEAATYEIHVAGERDRLEVVDVERTDRQPAPADDEIDAAIRIARADRGVASELDDGYEAHALLVSAVEQGDEHHGTRRFSVVFGPPTERLPRVHVIVDLVTEEVLRVHTNGQP